MYTISYHHKGSATEYPLYVPANGEYCILSGKLTLEMGKAGELQVSIPYSNPAKDSIVCLTDEVIVKRDMVELFRGRPITSQKDFNLTGKLVCEGVLAYLCDTYYPPFEHQGTPADLLEAVIENHNSFVSEDKQFTVGNITVVDNNDYINRSSVEYLRTIDILSDKFVGSSLGGYFRVRVENGEKFLDYLAHYGTTASQTISFGQNILDIASEIQYSDAITAILPLGKKNEKTGKALTVASVNAGDIYVRDTNLIAQRGFFAECVQWPDVTVASNLLQKAQNYLTQASSFVQSFTVKAVDLALVNSSQYTAFKIGDSVHIISTKHGVNQWSELQKMSLDLLNPASDSYEFGLSSTSNSLTGSTASNNRNIADSVSSLTVNFNRINADYASIDYLSANYIATDELDAEVARLGYAEITDLQAESARVDNLLATKANVTDLSAETARINNLSASYANVQNLLAGNAGVGTLQSIVLNSNNATIDSALIETVLANTAILGRLIAGEINTDDVTISNGDGTIVLTGGTQSFLDENEVVRVQIGQDALGNFTFILRDPTGQGVLIDADGIHEGAIGNELIVDRMVSNNAAIQASKLDINSLFNEINGSQLTLKSSRIYFDEQGQSLNQLYTQVQSNTTLAGNATSAAAVASSKAQAAQAAAEQALDAISGITTLSGFVVTLSNDAHVVHTLSDGSGGNYQNAFTVVKAYLGDTDVSDHTVFTALPSYGVIGTWDAQTKKFQVRNLMVDDGYVDFQCAYGHDHIYLTTRSGANLQTRSGNNLTMQSGSATITKRFSISKAPDGQVGTSYDLQCSTIILRKDTNNEFIPDAVTFSAIYNDGTAMRDFAGRFKIEESTDAINFVQKYMSPASEGYVTYLPTSQDIAAIRCTLYNAAADQVLDTQTVTVLIDAQGVLEDVQTALEVVDQSVQTVAQYTQAVDRMEVQFQELESTVIGYSDGRLLYQTPVTLNDDGTATIRAVVYKDGVDSTTEFEPRWFTWKIRTEEGTVPCPGGYWGYSTTVQVNGSELVESDMGYGGVVIGRFATYAEGYLLTSIGNTYCTRSGKQLLLWEPE